ncbi:MAG: hypothetical protein ABW202_14650 [Duganella sp.]
MPTISLTLRDDEGRLVIEALAELPFKTVFELIGDLNRQAVENGQAHDGARRYLLERDSLALILGALAQLPYERVHRLLPALEQQLRHGVPA